MHSATLDRLDQFEKEAKRERKPRMYLRRLSGLHMRWHMQRVRRVGFLLFHWHVIEHFKALRLDRELDIRADTKRDFNAGGRFKGARWEASMGGVPHSKSIPDLVGYSRAIEGWHNEAHMVIGEVTGLDMMDTRANVFFPEFWALHFFIDERFDEELASYAKAAGLKKRAPAAVVERVEDEHPGTVARI
jgi:hypothetical protein